MLQAPDVALTEPRWARACPGSSWRWPCAAWGFWFLEDGDRGAAHPLVPTSETVRTESDRHA